MADEQQVSIDTTEEVAVSRVYEAGYHIKPTVKEEDLDKVVGGIRSIIEKAGGSFIAEGAPVLTRLSYPMTVREGEKNIEYDRAYFGWIKFESTTETALSLEAALKRSADMVRSIVFRTVREDTRAKFRAPTLREVKRTDTLKTVVRREEASAGPVSEEDLEKALQDITTD